MQVLTEVLKYLIGLECIMQLPNTGLRYLLILFFLFCTFELSVLARLTLAQRNCELWWFSAEKKMLLRGTHGCMSLTAAQ